VNTWKRFLAERRDRLSWQGVAAPKELAEAENSLGVPLPSDLKAFLAEADGFYDIKSQYAYAWDVGTIVENNTLHWGYSDLRLNGDLLAFGADGSGTGVFCLAFAADADQSVYYWNWIDSARRRVAPDLSTFWSGWLDGTIAV
jgi:SMI1 / KNR4 family (SUKH-1)